MDSPFCLPNYSFICLFDLHSHNVHEWNFFYDHLIECFYQWVINWNWQFHVVNNSSIDSVYSLEVFFVYEWIFLMQVSKLYSFIDCNSTFFLVTQHCACIDRQECQFYLSHVFDSIFWIWVSESNFFQISCFFLQFLFNKKVHLIS